MKLRASWARRPAEGALAASRTSDTARFCTCTWAPAGMSWVAVPIDCPYFRTGSPLAMKRVASLWPNAIASTARTPSPATATPLAMRDAATTTLSAGFKRIASPAASLATSDMPTPSSATRASLGCEGGDFNAMIVADRA